MQDYFAIDFQRKEKSAANGDRTLEAATSVLTVDAQKRRSRNATQGFRLAANGSI